MFTEEQLNQLRGLLSPIEHRLTAIEQSQEQRRQDSNKEHEEIGGLITGLGEHTDAVVEVAQKKTVEVLTNRMKVTFEHQDKRITERP
jgi:hypothetical protein